jgi:tetratricopeptide (TPR) repeat protein
MISGQILTVAYAHTGHLVDDFSSQTSLLLLRAAHQENAKLLVTAGGKTVPEDICNLAPGRPYVREVCGSSDSSVQLLTREGQEIIQYTAPKVQNTITSLPEPATEPPPPKDIASNDELYVTGLHLEQYRHATRYPEPYWEEALERDPLDSRCNTALGLLKLKRGQFSEAERHFRCAIVRLTTRNPNPAEGDAYYYLGLALQPLRLDREDGAGAIVMSVAADGPGAKAGIQQGDIIAAWNGKPISNVHAVLRALGPDSVGQKVGLSLRRGGETQAVDLVIGERPNA